MTEPADHPDRPTADWVAVTQCATRADAEVVASALRGNDLDVRIRGDDGGGMLPQLNVIGPGITVEVPAADAAAAQGLLEQDLVPDDVLEAEALASDAPEATEDREAASTSSSRPTAGTDPAEVLAGRRSPGPWRALFILLVVLGLALALATVFLDLGA